MLRLYDTDLIARLNKHLNESGGNHENRNHFLTILIEAGLNRREREISFKDKLLSKETELYKSMDAFSERMAEFEKYIRTQFQAIGASDYIIRILISNIYYLSMANQSGIKITWDKLDDGRYDIPPERFKALEKTAKEVYIKNE